MADNAIEVDGVSKRYRLGEHVGGGNNLREVVAAYLTHKGRPPTDHVWSLRDVSLEVRVGTALGLVGRNGAGKSTLMKIITRITQPTSGVSRTRGRVGSLLEVGTGFHPDLTGRENVFLNGAVLGMGRRTIKERFDEIVSFAELERFIDTPVKRYSSGMYMRLAFAVAAHLDAEIVAIDEVLAVGDAEFQRRCLSKMAEIEHSGRTVLFVSHNLDALRQICPSAAWLDGGRIVALGPASEVVDAYVASGLVHRSGRRFEGAPNGIAQLRTVRIVGPTGEADEMLRQEEAFAIEIAFEVSQPVDTLDLSILLADGSGRTVFHEALSDNRPDGSYQPGSYRASVRVPPVLAVGDYTVSLWLGTAYEDLALEEHALHFRLEGAGDKRPDRLLRLNLPWELQRTGIEAV